MRNRIARMLPLVRYELLLGLRGAAGSFCLLACLVAGIAAGSADGMTPSLAGYRVTRLSALFLGFLALPLTAAAARRDATTRAFDTVHSRPHQAHELLLARWLGSLGVLLVMLTVLATATFASAALVSERTAREISPRFSALAVWHSLLIGALPLIFLSAVGYCLAELLRNALATAVIALYWLLVMLGRDYLARIYDFSLPQNAGPYLLLTAGVVLVGMWTVRYRQGLANARRANLLAVALLCLAAGVLYAWRLAHTRHDPPLHADPVTLTVASQDIRCGRLPGFWLRDQWGQMVRLHDWAGDPVVVAFWSPRDPASAYVLSALAALHEQFSPRGVHLVAVCLATDLGTGARFAREQGCRFPVVTDDGTHWAEALNQSSPLAEAYDLSGLPTVYVADGARNEVARLSATGPELTQAVAVALQTIRSE